MKLTNPGRLLNNFIHIPTSSYNCREKEVAKEDNIWSKSHSLSAFSMLAAEFHSVHSLEIEHTRTRSSQKDTRPMNDLAQT